MKYNINYPRLIIFQERANAFSGKHCLPSLE